MDSESDVGSWCIELWNQSDALLKANSDFNSQSDTYLRFFKDVSQMHYDIAKKYKKTINNYMPKKKATDQDPSQYVAFIDTLNSFNAMAEIHEKISKDLSDNVINEFKKFYDSSVAVNSKQNKSRAHIIKHIDDSRKSIETSWNQYMTAFKNKQKANDQNNKAQADDTLARQEQNKVEVNLRLKEKEYTDQELTYATKVKRYNESRMKSLSGNILNLIAILEEQEDLRSKVTKKALLDIAEKHKSTFEELASVTRLTVDSANKIDFKKDLNLLITKLKNDELFPVDLPFLSLDKCPHLEGTVLQLYNYMVGLNEVEQKVPKASFTSSLFKKSSKKEEMVNLSNPFINGIGLRNTKISDLTVLQIFKKTQELQKIIQNTENEIDASQKMISLYNSDPNLGDSSTVIPRLEIVQRKLHSLSKLKKELDDRYETLGGDSAKIKMEQKLERVYSNYTEMNAPTGTHSIESSIYNNTSKNSDTIDCEFDSDDNDDTGIESNSNASHPYSGTGPVLAQNEVLPPPPSLTVPKHVAIGIAKYEYAGNGDFYLACQFNEKFYVVAKDDSNSGWTEVVNQQGINGYVPTQYLELESPEQ